jgi:hypothetical protein
MLRSFGNVLQGAAGKGDGGKTDIFFGLVNEIPSELLLG